MKTSNIELGVATRVAFFLWLFSSLTCKETENAFFLWLLSSLTCKETENDWFGKWLAVTLVWEVVGCDKRLSLEAFI